MISIPEHFKGSPLLESLLPNAIANYSRYEEGRKHGEFYAKHKMNNTLKAKGYREGLHHGFKEGKEYGYKKGAFDMWSGEIKDFNPGHDKILFTDKGRIASWSNYAVELKSDHYPLYQEIDRIYPNPKKNQTDRIKNFTNRYNATKAEVTFKTEHGEMKVFNKGAGSFNTDSLKDKSGYNNYFSFSQSPKAIQNPYDGNFIPYKNLDRIQLGSDPIIGFSSPPTSPMKAIQGTPKKARTPKKNKG